MFKQALLATTLILGTATVAVPATAQVTVPTGLINVTIGDVTILENFLNNGQLTALNNIAVPIVVQVPVSVAAVVCPDVALLGQTGGPTACTATSGSQALADAAIKQALRARKNNR